jgi:metal-responsive CopG/Arc/MetJ family transcriptional regulator
MTSRTARSVTISVPAEMLEELDRVRRREHRSRSELLREAFRHYVDSEAMRRILSSSWSQAS